MTHASSQHSPNRPPGYVTVFTNARSAFGKCKLLTKSISLDESGALHKTSYDLAEVFNAEGFDCTPGGIHLLHMLLRKLSHRSDAAIVRAHIKPGLHAEGIHRRSYGETATLRDAHCSWMMVDIDNIKRPAHIRGGDLKATGRYVRSLLPKPFREAACVVQWSASAGFSSGKDPWKCIKTHIWFWLKDPATTEELRTYVKGLQSKLLDESLYNPGQLHYTAAPILCPQLKDRIQERTILLEGRKAVDLSSELKTIRKHLRRCEIERSLQKQRFVSKPSSRRFRTASLKTSAQRALEHETNTLRNAPVGERHRVLLQVTGRLAWWIQKGSIGRSEAEREIERAFPDADRHEIRNAFNHCLKCEGRA